MSTPETKSFPLNVVLTVTTGRLLTTAKGERDNGIGDLYEILGWICDDQPYTHQLGRFAQEAKPHLLKWFPELAAASSELALASLDKWMESTKRSGAKDQACLMWLTELKMMNLGLKATYDIPQIPKNAHVEKDPVAELIELRGGHEGIVVIQH